ncbi:MAG TPA: hypothetical protein VJ436_06440 [Anaerolineales bacterium]|nr:hypothetical protein [Anaerolineales bacterium]
MPNPSKNLPLNPEQIAARPERELGREADDCVLLRRFEPVIRYSRGEQFFPCDVEPYVRNSSLWMQRPGELPVCLVPEGYLDLEHLARPYAHGFATVYFLKFIDPLNVKDLAVYRLKQGLRKKDPIEVFKAGRGRLARVGYGSRFVDALFSLSLLARGRVPGDTAAAAALAYQQMRGGNPDYLYYGRVVRQGGWVALQYWFFYPFNNWRSGFFGANDHEADWEMIYVYLSEGSGGQLQPEWVAYASHDFSGDDLRRRWDDPELEKSGEHPVIYAGAGSHASYFARGEYLTELELPFLSPLVRVVDFVQGLWRKIVREAQGRVDGRENASNFNVFRVPFVDYARGDGLALGPGGDLEWSDPQLLDPPPEWVIRYRGLWGLYARDPIAGENAPAGPVYHRDGRVRRSWYDPLGWAGLDKVAPRDQSLERVLERRQEILEERQSLAVEIAQKSERLVKLGIEADAMQGRPHLRLMSAQHRQQILGLSAELNDLRARYAADGELLEALDLYAGDLQRGERGPARAHLRRAHTPASDTGLRISRLAEGWAAISIGLMMLSFVGIVLFARQYLLVGLLAMVPIIIFLEAGFRRRLTRLINALTITLAVLATGVLVYEFFWPLVVFLVLLAGGYIIWENVKELRA